MRDGDGDGEGVGVRQKMQNEATREMVDALSGFLEVLTAEGGEDDADADADADAELGEGWDKLVPTPLFEKG